MNLFSWFDESKSDAVQIWAKPVLPTASRLLFWHCKASVTFHFYSLAHGSDLLLFIFLEQLVSIVRYLVCTSFLCLMISTQFNLKRGGQRVATMLMYLTDDVEGGETYFPLVCIASSSSCGGSLYTTHLFLLYIMSESRNQCVYFYVSLYSNAGWWWWMHLWWQNHERHFCETHQRRRSSLLEHGLFYSLAFLIQTWIMWTALCFILVSSLVLFRGLMDSQIQRAYMEDVKFYLARNGQLLNGWDKKLLPEGLGTLIN